jgi:hypothetical protein
LQVRKSQRGKRLPLSHIHGIYHGFKAQYSQEAR